VYTGEREERRRTKGFPDFSGPLRYGRFCVMKRPAALYLLWMLRTKAAGLDEDEKA